MVGRQGGFTELGPQQSSRRFFPELSFPSASSKQVKNPTEGPSLSPPFPPPPSAVSSPTLGVGRSGMQRGGCRGGE